MFLCKKSSLVNFKKNSILKAIVFLGLFALTSCAMFNGSGAINLSKENNGKNVKSKIGDTIVINLKGNATTGYTWILKKYNEELIKFIDVKYETDNSKLMGAGGAWIAQFQVIKSGTSKIEFVYKRPWETEETPLQDYFVTITAKQ